MITRNPQGPRPLSRRQAIQSLAILAGGVVFVSARTAQANPNNQVAYRRDVWKTSHFDDIKQAKHHVEMLKRLGCEVKEARHSDHYDVQYRCPKWRMIRAKTHADAHKLEAWLKHFGFETKHDH